MEADNHFYRALVEYFPTKQEQLWNYLTVNARDGYQNQAEQAHLSNSEAVDRKGHIFTHFSQLTEGLKNLLGAEDFRLFIDYYINKVPEHNVEFKRVMVKLEQDVLDLEVKEAQKFQNLNLPLPVTLSNKETGPQLFTHSTLSSDMHQEFKDAKWVALTSPLIQSRPSKSSRDGPPTLSSATSTGTPYGNYTISLNNLNSNGNRQQLSATTSAAAQAKLGSMAPQKRYGHSACLVKNKMYIFGGLASQQKGGNLKTFYECHLKFTTASGIGLANQEDAVNGGQCLFQWDQIKAEAPRARDSHTCIHTGDAMIMFGGSGGSNSFNDLYKFDLRSQKWSKLEPFGELPAPREGHIAKLIGKDKMMVHGGVDQDETSFSDTFVLTGIQQFIDDDQISSIYSAYIPQPFEFKPTPQQDCSFQPFEEGSLLDTMAQPLQSTEKSLYSNHQAVTNGIKKSLRWYKCTERGPVPQGRDSHSSALINNKVYIFGGQGDGDMIFDDLYSVEIIEEMDSNGQTRYIAQWTLLENQTPKGQKPLISKPRARTSHTCTVYKNRYMVIIGGEGEFDEKELSQMKSNRGRKKKDITTTTQSKKLTSTNGNEDDICVDLENEGSSESVEEVKTSAEVNKEQDEDDDLGNKRPLNDVWVYDTLMNKWHEIRAPFRIQGSLLGKKLKKEFEPRMAHSAVQLNQFIVIFGGLGTDQLVSNDLYVLSLDGNLDSISLSLEPDQAHQVPQNQSLRVNEAIATCSSFERSQSISGLTHHVLNQSKSVKISKDRALKISNPEDRRVMSGQILNQIINYSAGQTNQFFITGGNVTNNITAPSQMPAADVSGGNKLKFDCEIQTIDAQSSNYTDIGMDPKEQLMMILKESDFKLSSFQRTKFSFIKSMADQITWPLQCFAGFIDNSIEAFDIAKTKHEASKGQQPGLVMNHQRFNSTLDIEINLIQYGGGSHDEKYSTKSYLEIKDNGTGIHPKELMEALTTFGTASNASKSKSSHVFAEHGVGIKLNSLRLAQSTLIITRTKPVHDCGSTTFHVSFGLLSTDFMKQAGSSNGLLVAPIVSMEIKNKRISRNLTPEPEHFLNMISQFTKPKFDSGEKLLQYAMNAMNDLGGTHIFMFNLTKHKIGKNLPDVCEYGLEKNDIVLNPAVFGVQDNSQIEKNLSSYLKYLYIEYPQWVKIRVNEKPLDLQNPYALLKNTQANAFVRQKSDKFAVQILDSNILYQNIIQISAQIDLDLKTQAGSELGQLQPGEEALDATVASRLSQYKEWLRQTNTYLEGLEGVLIYRGNRLIRRMDSLFGEERVVPTTKDKQVNAIVSTFMSRSTTTLEKSDFSDKQINKKVKEWFKNYSLLQESANQQQSGGN